MHFDEVETDGRVIVRTSRGTAHGTAVAPVIADITAPMVLVVYDNGQLLCHKAEQLSPLHPMDDVRDPAALPRLRRRSFGHTFWRGGRLWFVYRYVDTWRVLEWHDDENVDTELLVRDKRTRKEAVAEAVAKADARSVMKFHPDPLPSIRFDVSRSRLAGKGWEVYAIEAAGMYEVALEGELIASIEHGDNGRWYSELLFDGSTVAVGRDLPHIESAAMVVRAQFG